MSETQTIEHSNLAPVHEPLSDKRLGAYLAAAGNHESKAIVLLGMQPDVGYGITALHRLYVDPQGESPAHTGSVNNQMQYCELSFEPIAAVAKVSLSDGIKYEITDEGELIGKGIAGHLLAFSDRHPEISLRGVLGATRTNGNDREVRSPQRRLQIIQELLLQTEVGSVVGLAGSTQIEPGNLREHLRSLENAGLITVEATNSKDLRIGYQVHEPIVLREVPKSKAELTQEVVNVINGLTLQHAVVEIGSVEAELRKISRYGDQSSLRGQVGRILRQLARENYIESLGGLDHFDLSRVTIREERREALTELIELVWDLSSGDPAVYEDGAKKGRAILTDPRKVRALVAKAHANSPESNGVPQNLRFKRVIQFLGSTTLPKTTQIIEALENQGLTRGSTRTTLLQMRKLGLIESISEDNENYWAVKRPDPN